MSDKRGKKGLVVAVGWPDRVLVGTALSVVLAELGVSRKVYSRLRGLSAGTGVLGGATVVPGKDGAWYIVEDVKVMKVRGRNGDINEKRANGNN